jgi:mRNA-degrading endonuclease RelE of RelBE toxin-antitoxin system
MIIKFTKNFDKSYQKLSIKLQDKFNEKLIIFEKDKKASVLNNHTLL